MPRLRTLSGKEVCRILESYGFENVRQRGSHVIMQFRGTPTITIPVPLHRELAAGTLRSIIRQSGVDRGEFEVGS